MGTWTSSASRSRTCVGTLVQAESITSWRSLFAQGKPEVSADDIRYDEGVVLLVNSGRTKVSLGVAVHIVMTLPPPDRMACAIRRSDKSVLNYQDIERIHQRSDFPREP